MYRGFAAYLEAGKISRMPRMYAVQSGEVFSVAEEFEENGCLISSENISREGISAGRLGIKHTKRKREILEVIAKTGGRGVYVSGQEIREADALLDKFHLDDLA